MKLIQGNFIKILAWSIVLIGLHNCTSLKRISKQDKEITYYNVYPEATQEDIKRIISEKEAAPRDVLLIHVDADITVIFPEEKLDARAKLFLYNNSGNNSIKIDAKYMNIKNITLFHKGKNWKPDWHYDSLQIIINNINWSKDDTLIVDISYEAHHTKNFRGGVKFKEGNILWTHGEPENNSFWLPLIDKPNQKLTHKIKVKVPDTLVTLSNGFLISSKKEAGWLEETWIQEKPHAPYLITLVVGPYIIENDTTNTIPIYNYIKKEYEGLGNKIYSNAAEIINFFSKTFKYPYVWGKLANVAVPEFVAGAMENTSAIVYNQSVEKYPDELVDADNEEIIAHEIAHHWFGNLLTCKSWSQIALNESFATFAEYLWLEHKYSKETTLFHMYFDKMHYYLEWKFLKRDKIISHIYQDPEYLFDAHRYQKGGLVINLLRETLGDSVFFEGLAKYLKYNEFNVVEITNLRLAMEEASKRDLRKFFTYWWETNATPQIELIIPPKNNKDTLTLSLKCQLCPDTSIKVLIKTNYSTQIQQIKINDTFTTFKIPSSNLIYISLEPYYHLPYFTNEKKTTEMWEQQFYTSENSLSRYVAAKQLLETLPTDLTKKTSKIYEMLTKEKNKIIRNLLLESLSAVKDSLPFQKKQLLLPTLLDIQEKDEYPSNRKLALEIIEKINPDTAFSIAIKKINLDSSAQVRAKAFSILLNRNITFVDTVWQILSQKFDKRLALTLLPYLMKLQKKDLPEIIKTYSQKITSHWHRVEITWAILNNISYVKDQEITEKLIKEILSYNDQLKSRKWAYNQYRSTLKKFTQTPQYASLPTSIKEEISKIIK